MADYKRLLLPKSWNVSEEVDAANDALAEAITSFNEAESVIEAIADRAEASATSAAQSAEDLQDAVMQADEDAAAAQESATASAASATAAQASADSASASATAASESATTAQTAAASAVETLDNARSLVAESIAEIVAEAPEDFDTLKEISDWIDEHEDSAAAMNTAIAAKQDKALSEKVGEAETVESALKQEYLIRECDHKCAVTMYDAYANLPSVINFTTGAVVAVGEKAYCITEQKWYKVTAVDTETLAITWEEFDAKISATIPQATGSVFGLVKLTDSKNNKSGADDGIAATPQMVRNYAPPMSHASTGTTFGIGTTARYGHVKLNNNGATTYQDKIDAGEMEASEIDGVVPSMLALEQARKALSSKIDTAAAPRSHASATKDFGIADTGHFGHVRFTDNPYSTGYPVDSEGNPVSGTADSDFAGYSIAGLAPSMTAMQTLSNRIESGLAQQQSGNSNTYNAALGWAFGAMSAGTEVVSDSVSGYTIKNSQHILLRVSVISGNGTYTISNPRATNGGAVCNCARLVLVFSSSSEYDSDKSAAYIVAAGSSISVPLQIDAVSDIVII